MTWKAVPCGASDGDWLLVMDGETEETAVTEICNCDEGVARLIAAAPDLLEALRGALGALEFGRDYHRDLGNEDQAFCADRLDAALAAIRKAQGEGE